MKLNTYEQFADEYARSMRQPEQRAFSLNHDLVIPRLLEVAGNLNDLTVLDAGCGEGFVSRQLAERGANVVGVDVAPRFIELAKEHESAEGILYRAHNLSEPLPEYEEHFDVVVSNLVLNDVPDYRGFAATLSFVTKPEGRLVLSLTNPYSAVMRQKVNSYFDSGFATKYDWADVEIYHYHRMTSEYIAAFCDAGCLLRNLHDLQITAEMASHLPEISLAQPWAEMYPRFPFFIVLEFIKMK